MLIRTGNHGHECGCYDKYDEEQYTLQSIKENDLNGHYHECTILILNYLGHVNHYCTHEDLIYKLLISLSYSIERDPKDLPLFINRLINNVKTYRARGL